MWFRSGDRLQPHERAILLAVADAAPDRMEHTLRAQIDQISYVQRVAGSPEVNFYARHRRPGGWNSRWLFPNRAETHVADVTIRIDGRRHAASLYAVDGHLFALTLRPQPGKHKGAEAEVLDVRLADPRHPFERGDVDAALQLPPPSFVHGGEALAGRAPVGWTIFEPAEAYLVSLPDADWTVLAQGPQGHLLLGRVSEEGESFSLADIETDVLTRLDAVSFAPALEEADRRST